MTTAAAQGLHPGGRTHIEWSRPGYVVATWKNVLIVLVARETTSELLKATLDAHCAVHARHPEGIGVFTSMRGLPSLPSREVRDQAAQSIRSTAGEVRGQVAVINAEGFWGSATRSVMAAVNMLARAPNPTGVCGTDADGADWLSQHASIGDPQTWCDGLMSALAQAEAALADEEAVSESA